MGENGEEYEHEVVEEGEGNVEGEGEEYVEEYHQYVDENGNVIEMEGEEGEMVHGDEHDDGEEGQK